MKKIYRKNAFYLDKDILLFGYKDKYGFHPNKNTNCGFTLQRINKKDIGKNLFYSLSDAVKELGPVNISGVKLLIAIDAGLYITKIMLSIVGSEKKYSYISHTVLSKNRDNVQDVINEVLTNIGVNSLYNSEIHFCFTDESYLMHCYKIIFKIFT